MSAGDVFFAALGLVLLLSFIAALASHDWLSVVVLAGVGVAVPHLRNACRDPRRW